MGIKKILVLYKKSVYTNYFLDRHSSLRHKERLMPKKNMRRLKNVHVQHYETLRIVEQCLKAYSLHYAKTNRGRDVDYSGFDLVITVGGDGTFLEGARNITDQWILGVNSSPQWSVGKFCAATVQTFPALFKKVMEGNFRGKVLRRLCIRRIKQLRSVNVLNDILIAHKNPAAMSRYYLTIKDQSEEQRSSGIWISTAAGSTGAIHSAGGRILPMESKDFQYLCRELYYGKRNAYKLKKGILSPAQSITVTSLMREGMIFVDGSRLLCPFGFGQTINIRHSATGLKTIWV